MKKSIHESSYSFLVLWTVLLLCVGCIDNPPEPDPIPDLKPAEFIKVSADYHHSLALEKDGKLWAWGYNTFGQLGISTFSNTYYPVLIDSGYTEISTGSLTGYFSGTIVNSFYSMGIKSDGSLWAWGSNQEGQLGDGTYTNASNPVYIGSDYTAVSAGGAHTLAIKKDSSLWAWGFNYYGQLGDGSKVDKNVPTHIGDGYISISAGRKHSLAIKSDGSMWAWGANGF